MNNGYVIFMDASVLLLHKLHAVQKIAEKLCQITFQSLLSHCKASTIGLLCKLLNSNCQQPLQIFCPILISVTHPCHLQYAIESDDPLLLQSFVKYNHLIYFWT